MNAIAQADTRASCVLLEQLVAAVNALPGVVHQTAQLAGDGDWTALDRLECLAVSAEGIRRYSLLVRHALQDEWRTP